MLLSEMLGVERGKKFQIEGYKGLEFSVNNNFDGKDKLYFRDPANHWWDVATPKMLFNIIDGAPANIIHLPPPMTDEQREQLKAIWTLGGRWLAKDMPGDTFAFGYTPVKDMEWLSWIPSNDDKGENLFSIYRDFDVCNLVSWSDPEPYDIAKALGVEG